MRRSVSFGVKGLGFVFAVSSLVAACGGDGETGDRPDDEGTGGTSGTGPTGGSSGTATGGASGSATGGASGSATGGSAGTASCIAPITSCDPPCMPATCEVVTPPQALITDFSNLENGQLFGAKDSTGAYIPNWYEPGHFFGGIFAYPIPPNMCSTDMTAHAYPITSDACSGEWRLTGEVGEYSGFGFWLEKCLVDMSAYSGISFKIGGSVGPSGTVKFSVRHGANAAPSMCSTNRGTCTLGEGCLAATTTITVPSTPTVVTVRWEDLTGGAPEAELNPAEVTGIDFALDCTDCTMTPYELDLTIDDVTLVE